MTQFRTSISAKRNAWDISHEKDVLLLGSCFSDNIGTKLAEDKFGVFVNPFGTLFSPNAIQNIIERSADGDKFKPEEFFENNGLWHHWSLNGNFCSTDLKALVSHCNVKLDELKSTISNSSYLIITLGTAWVYALKSDYSVVANCHKMNSGLFDKQCLSVDHVSRSLQEIISSCRSLNLDLKIIFTVSPVRHWKDGAVNNFKSKSTLRLGIEKVLDDSIQYFPAYEVLIDDLRDYRFYEKDMLHPK